MNATLYTFIPVILIFGWLSANLAYNPLVAQEKFTLTAVFHDKAVGEATLVLPEGVKLADGSLIQKVSRTVVWNLIPEKAGTYDLKVNYNNMGFDAKPLIVSSSSDKNYGTVEYSYKKGFFGIGAGEPSLEALSLGNKKIVPFADVPLVKDIPWVGTWTWFGAYILYSLVFSMALRKVFDVY